MKPLAETLEDKTKCICEKLLERALDDDDWTRMKLPTSLGGMGIRAVTSRLETSSEITVKKTRAQAGRIEKSLAGEQRDHTSWESGTERYEMWDPNFVGIRVPERSFSWFLTSCCDELQFSTLSSLRWHQGCVRGPVAGFVFKPYSTNGPCELMWVPGQNLPRCEVCNPGLVPHIIFRLLQWPVLVRLEVSLTSSSPVGVQFSLSLILSSGGSHLGGIRDVFKVLFTVFQQCPPSPFGSQVSVSPATCECTNQVPPLAPHIMASSFSHWVQLSLLWAQALCFADSVPRVFDPAFSSLEEGAWWFLPFRLRFGVEPCHLPACLRHLMSHLPSMMWVEALWFRGRESLSSLQLLLTARDSEGTRSSLGFFG